MSNPIDSAEIRRRVRRAVDEPGGLQPLLAGLTARAAAQRCEAAAALRLLGAEAPAVLATESRRLFRLLGAADDVTVRKALAACLPLLSLSQGEAARALFVLTTWLDDTDLDVRRAVLEAMIALLPSCPRQLTRVRQEIRQRAAAGAPVLRSYGLDLLESIRDF